MRFFAAERAQWVAESKLGDYQSASARIAYSEKTVRDMHQLQRDNPR